MSRKSSRIEARLNPWTLVIAPSLSFAKSTMQLVSASSGDALAILAFNKGPTRFPCNPFRNAVLNQ
jgi:hypothetical protein